MKAIRTGLVALVATAVRAMGLDDLRPFDPAELAHAIAGAAYAR